MNASVATHPLASPSRSARAGALAARGELLIVAGLTVLGAVLRFTRIGHQSFWYDESFTVLLVHHSPAQMLGLLPQTELTPPLYYLLAWPWARIFGYGEAGLRSLSALAGVATIPAIYAAAAALVSRRAGLVAAAVACCNPLLVWYSQEARSYAVLILLTTLTLLAFARARVSPPARRLAAWALAACLTLATHYYGILVVAPEAVWLLWVHRRDRRIYLAVAAVGAFGLALLPIAISQRPQASWIAPWRLDLRLQQIPTQFLLGTGAPARTVLELMGAAATVLAVAMLARAADGHERRGAILAGALAVSGLILSLALLLAGVDELITRNVMVVLIPLIVLVAGGLGARRAGLPGLAGAAVICVIGIAAVIGVNADTTLQRPDWRALAHALGADRRTPGGRAVLLQRDVFLMPLGLDMPGLHFVTTRGARVSELDVVAIAAPSDSWFCWWGSGCNLLSSKLDTRIRVRGFRRFGPVVRIDQFSILRLRSAAAVRLTPREVSRALIRAPLRASLPQPPDLPPGFGPPYSYGLLAQPPA